jgi:hypothetical protein
MLMKFRIEYCEPFNKPMVIGCKLRKDDDSLEENQTLYRSIIGILLYMTTSRLEIVQEVGFVAWFQDAPKETHVEVVKIIFRYLKETLNFGS